NAIALETFDRQYVLLGTIGRKTQTRANGHTVETNSASTANALITTSFGPCYANVVTQNGQKRLVAVRGYRSLAAVDSEYKGHTHRRRSRSNAISATCMTMRGMTRRR